MKVPYNYLPIEFRKSNKILSHWKKLIQSTDFTLGKYVVEFEKKFSKYIGAKYVISTNNGTDALILSLKSIGVRMVKSACFIAKNTTSELTKKITPININKNISKGFSGIFQL